MVLMDPNGTLGSLRIYLGYLVESEKLTRTQRDYHSPWVTQVTPNDDQKSSRRSLGIPRDS